jgi:hypothetical protein
VSVVIIAPAASSHLLELKSEKAVGILCTISSLFKGSPIIPVEKGNTSSIRQLPFFATARHTLNAALSPATPVPALAFPELITKNLGLNVFTWDLANDTGAAQNLFCVKTQDVFALSTNSIKAKSGLPL